LALANATEFGVGHYAALIVSSESQRLLNTMELYLPDSSHLDFIWRVTNTVMGCDILRAEVNLNTTRTNMSVAEMGYRAIGSELREFTDFVNTSLFDDSVANTSRRLQIVDCRAAYESCEREWEAAETFPTKF